MLLRARVLGVLVCCVVVLVLVGAVSASADSWSVEGGAHYLRGGGGELLRKWSPVEWQTWRKEVQALGECMGVLSSCAERELRGETPVEDVTRAGAEAAQRGVERERTNRPINEGVQSALDSAGIGSGTLPADLGSNSIMKATFLPGVIGVELGNGLDQLYEIPRWSPLSPSELYTTETHGEHLASPVYPVIENTKECPSGPESCKTGTFELPPGWYLESGFYAIRRLEYGEHECETKEGKRTCVPYRRETPTKAETYIPPGFVGFTEFGEQIAWSYEEYGFVEAYSVNTYAWKPFNQCGLPPAGLTCKPLGIPAPGLITKEVEEKNVEVGLPAIPQETAPVHLPASPPSSFNEADLETLSENKEGREQIEAMFTEKAREEHELAEKLSETLGGSNAGSPGRTSCHADKPVNCATGNEFVEQTDLSVGGRGPALKLALTYNSQLASAPHAVAGPFGFGWLGSYSAFVEVKPEYGEAVVHQDNGSTTTFWSSPEGWQPIGGAITQGTLASESGGYLYTLPDQTKEYLGSSGLLTSVVDRDGNTLTMSRNSEGRLESVADSAGRKLSLKYNSEGQVESASDPMGHTVKYSYEGGNLASVTLPGEAGARWQYKYNAAHELTSEKDGRGYTTTIEYNAEGQVASETDPLHRTRKWAYTPTSTGTETTITEPNGSTTVEDFNEYGSPTKVTQAEGTSLAATSTNSYSSADKLLASTNPDKHTTEYGYDAAGYRTSEKNADGDETKWEYDSTHDVTGITTPMGEKTTIKRNSHGEAEVIERAAPASTTQKTSYKYDSAGDVESVTNPLEHTWKYEYDAYGDRKSETDPEANKRTWEYNEDSQETATVSPRGNATGAEASKFTTKTERDAQGRPLKITDPLGHTTKYTYDADGNLETITDGNAHKTTYSYDEGDEMVKVKEANGDVSETEYDAAGNAIARIDGNRHRWKYVRNELERVTEAIDPLGHKTINEYDLVGDLTKRTDPQKRATTYTYDPAGRLTEVSYSDGKTPTVKYEYNKDGDRTTMTDGTGTTANTYDQLDRVTESENGHKAITKYEYDLANDQTKLTYPNGKAVTRAFDKDSRLEKITDWSSNATKFTYNQDSQLATTVFPTVTKDEDTYAYNNADQMTETKMKKGSETLASLVYTRDNDGQLKKTTSKSLPGSEVTEDTYDEDNRLTKSASTEYKYDPANNPTTTGTSTNTFNEADELTKATSAGYSYDELGERTKTTPTSGPATSYGYDQASNLITIERPKEGETAQIEDTYAYNGEGLPTNETISGTTKYLAWQTTGVELPSILTNETNSFIYGPGSMPTEQINNTTGAVTYLHHDQQGSTRLLTGSTGVKEASFTYDAYGNQTGHTGTVTTPLGYDAQYTSSDTGLIYMRARVYDPATAQFLSVDPMVGQTHAPYNYAEDSPLNEADPTGLAKGSKASRLLQLLRTTVSSREGVQHGIEGITHGLESVWNPIKDYEGPKDEAKPRYMKRKPNATSRVTQRDRAAVLKRGRVVLATRAKGPRKPLYKESRVDYQGLQSARSAPLGLQTASGQASSVEEIPID